MDTSKLRYKILDRLRFYLLLFLLCFICFPHARLLRFSTFLYTSLDAFPRKMLPVWHSAFSCTFFASWFWPHRI